MAKSMGDFKPRSCTYKPVSWQQAAYLYIIPGP